MAVLAFIPLVIFAGILVFFIRVVLAKDIARAKPAGKVALWLVAVMLTVACTIALSMGTCIAFAWWSNA